MKTLLPALYLMFALTAQDEAIVFEFDVDLVLGESWQLSLQHQGIFGLEDVDRGRPGARKPGAFVIGRSAEHLAEEAVHLIAHRYEVPSRIPTHDSHD